MTIDDRKQRGGFANDDDLIRREQDQDLNDDNENGPLPDPAGERHDPEAREQRIADIQDTTEGTQP